MNQTEKLEPVSEETELLPDEVSELRSEMWDKISDALDLGVFTDKEATDWEEGFLACDRLEYMYNLIEIIDDFIASGEEVVDELQSTLNTELLSEAEKTEAEWQADMLCYQDKLDLIKDLRITIQQVKHYKQQLLKLLQVSKLSLEESAVWLQKFAEADADKKEGVIMRVANKAIEINEHYPAVQRRITELLNNSQFRDARQFLLDSRLGSGEYAQLTEKVDAAEANYFRRIVQSA